MLRTFPKKDTFVKYVLLIISSIFEDVVKINNLQHCEG